MKKLITRILLPFSLALAACTEEPRKPEFSNCEVVGIYMGPNLSSQVIVHCEGRTRVAHLTTCSVYRVFMDGNGEVREFNDLKRACK